MSSVIAEHWQERKSKKLGSSSYRYRRVIKPELRSTLGKGEITIALGNAKGDALAKYRQVHREVEQMLAAAWDEVRGISRPAQFEFVWYVGVKQAAAERFTASASAWNGSLNLTVERIAQIKFN